MSVPYLLTVPEHADKTGNLCFADRTVIPFVPQRAFWITNVSGERGNHAHKQCQQFVICLQGRCKIDVHSEDGIAATYYLEEPVAGLYIPELTYISIEPLTNDAIILVLASEEYDPEDYIYSVHETFTYAGIIQGA